MASTIEDVFLICGSKPLKVTFTRVQFFSGLEGKNERIGMVKAYICRTAPESLVSYGVLFTVLTFHFFRHGNFVCSLFIDTFPGIRAIKKPTTRGATLIAIISPRPYLVAVFPLCFSAHLCYRLQVSARNHNCNNFRSKRYFY